MGDNGEVSTYPAFEAGVRLELPMVRDAGDPPPCSVCPKIPDGRPKSWEHADEFDDSFWDVQGWFRECRAVGDFGQPDPLMRAVAAEFDAAERRARSERDGGALVALAKMIGRR